MQETRGCVRFARSWSKMRSIGFATLLGALSGCGGSQLPKAQVASRGEALFNGEVKTEINCYHCHDGDGSGTLWGPNLAKRVPKLTDAQIANAIAEGPGIMPSFKGKLSDADVRDIIAWLRSRFPR